MTTVSFRDSLMYAADHPLTIGRAYKAYAAYAGIHSVDFGKSRNPWLNPNWWITYDTNWSFTDDGLTGESDIGISDIFSAHDNISLPYSSVLKLLVTGSGGVFLKYKNQYDYFFVGWGSGRVEILRAHPQLGGMLSSMPVTMTGESEITIMYRDFQYSSVEEDRWFNIAVWIDGEHIMAASQKIGLQVLGTRLGFRIGHGSSLKWHENYDPVFSLPIDWASLDPGESPLAGLQRAVGERHIRHFIRFDGTLKVLRPGSRDIDFTLGRSDWSEVAFEEGIRELASHIRVWGAYHQAEVYDEELARLYGHRFIEVNNPDLYTYEACQVEAETIMRKLRSMAYRINFEMNFQPLIEPEDRIETVDGDYIMDSGEVSLQRHAITLGVNGRKYVE